ncbi:MAG: formate--tetrahydrofolate ligase, partial [Rhodospirillaceae bacterium]|nr:formate--tetrahydrofolate ligase [Rhodospirillaceae bacterium]
DSGSLYTQCVPAVVAINRFSADTDAELDAVRQLCAELGSEAIECNHWSSGSAGVEQLANAVVKLTDGPSSFKPLYPDDMSLWDKTRTIAQSLYGAQGIIADKAVRDRFASNHVVPIREIRLSAGAEFIVVVCGEIMTMPGLPRVPSANHIRLNDKGEVEGLF